MHNSSTLHFLKAGLWTTVQDKGRIGHQASGVPVSGAMDQTAAQLANWLVGNAEDHPVLEITLLGPSIQINHTVQIAITGANLSPMVSGTPIPMYETIAIDKGAILKFGRIQNGCRAYLAVGGQWMVQRWLGSASAATTSTAKLTPDSLIKKDSLLTIQATPFIEKRNSPPPPDYENSIVVNVLPGPEFDQFSSHTIAHFFSQTYTIANDSNRMGYRLLGKELSTESKQEVISSGIVVGTIQVSNAGQPILLMRDAQTTGGYPRIAVVLPEELDRLAQLKPGEAVRFCFIS